MFDNCTDLPGGPGAVGYDVFIFVTIKDVFCDGDVQAVSASMGCSSNQGLLKLVKCPAFGVARNGLEQCHIVVFNKLVADVAATHGTMSMITL